MRILAKSEISFLDWNNYAQRISVTTALVWKLPIFQRLEGTLDGRDLCSCLRAFSFQKDFFLHFAVWMKMSVGSRDMNAEV